MHVASPDTNANTHGLHQHRSTKNYTTKEDSRRVTKQKKHEKQEEQEKEPEEKKT